MTGIGKNSQVPILAVGGMADHIHNADRATSDDDIVEGDPALKANSSRWMAEHKAGFAWQEGYGAFSVSPSNVPVVKRYIREREARHLLC